MGEAVKAPLVLVVEDDPEVAALELEWLQQAGLRTAHLDRGDAVVTCVRAAPPDLVVLDVVLPGLAGTDVCRALRAFSAVPIMMVSTRAAEGDRLLAFELGADDYLCKPFSPRELVARVQAVLRRAGRLPLPGAAGGTAARLLAIVPEQQRALWRGQPLDLTPQQYRLLAVLAAQPGRVFTRAHLIELAYDRSEEVFERAVDSHVKNLRRKLASSAPDHEFIHSIYGVGYRFEALAKGQPASDRPVKQRATAGRVVRLDPDVERRLPRFLASRRALLEEAGQALARGDLEEVRRYAHRLAGGFALYGFTWAAGECVAFEGEPAVTPPLAEAWLARIAHHLDTVEIRFA